MSAAANIVAFDGAATPVSHTFSPIGNEVSALAEQISKWRETIASLPLAACITVKTSMRRLKSGIYRVALIVDVPVMESIGSSNAAGYTAAPKVAYTNGYQFIGYFSERSTATERRLGRQLFTNILNGTTTTVTPVTVGPAAELIDSLITAQ